jgi:hypothetical protein
MKLFKTAMTFAFLQLALLVSGVPEIATAGSDRVPEVQRKVQELQKQMSKVSEIGTMMDKEFRPLMDAQKFEAAEKVVDAALAKLKEFKASP